MHHRVNEKETDKRIKRLKKPQPDCPEIHDLYGPLKDRFNKKMYADHLFDARRPI